MIYQSLIEGKAGVEPAFSAPITAPWFEARTGYVPVVPRLGVKPRTFALKGRSYFLLSLRGIKVSAECRARTDRPQFGKLTLYQR